MNTKESVISNSASTLKADGTLYGATILDSGVTHNKFGSKLINIYNKTGIFNNWQDSLVIYVQSLKLTFGKSSSKLTEQ